MSLLSKNSIPSENSSQNEGETKDFFIYTKGKRAYGQQTHSIRNFKGNSQANGKGNHMET